jgi:hypothetical protein
VSVVKGSRFGLSQPNSEIKKSLPKKSGIGFAASPRVDIMVTKTSNGKIKRASKGMRKHMRLMKQEARKAGVPVNELKKRVRAPQVSKKEA